jgi:hypothetical protein
MPIAPSIIAPQSAEDTFGVFPQHFHRVISPTSAEQGGCFHLSDSLAEPITMTATPNNIPYES